MRCWIALYPVFTSSKRFIAVTSGEAHKTLNPCKYDIASFIKRINVKVCALAKCWNALCPVFTSNKRFVAETSGEANKTLSLCQYGIASFFKRITTKIALLARCWNALYPVLTSNKRFVAETSGEANKTLSPCKYYIASFFKRITTKIALLARCWNELYPVFTSNKRLGAQNWARLQNTPQLYLFGAATENGYAVGASTGYERIGYDSKRVIFWWLREHAFTEHFIDFFPVFQWNLAVVLSIFFCSAAKWSNSFTGFIMVILMIDNVYEEYFPHICSFYAWLLLRLVFL